MKNGFTLIELLAVIVILSIIALITFLSVNTILNNSKETLSEAQKNNIIEAAKTYYLKEGNMLVDATCVNVSDLLSKGYIDANEVIDPKTKKELLGSVEITYEANHYNYEYQTDLCE